MNNFNVVPEYAKGRKKLSANTHRLMESYKDDYPSHAKGIFQEAIQNSIDAKFSEYKNVKITIKYDSKKRILYIRDYGTTGMSHCSKCYWGRRNDSKEECHESNCNWGNFHYLGGLAKGVGDLGSRGQGKSLLIIAGTKTIIRTKLTNDKSKSGNDMCTTMASQWIRDQDDWEWELIPEQSMSDSDPAGSEIIIYGVIDEVHEQLIKVDEIIRDISQTWCAAIKKGVQIRYGLIDKTLEKIGVPHYPSPVTDSKGKPVKKFISVLPVTYHGQLVGDLHDVTIYLADEPVPEGIRGIALIKKGNQVITRITEWGRKNRRELQDRVYGWANYDCSPAKPFLCACEKPTHRGFTPHPHYTKVHDILQNKVEDFLSPYEKEMFKPRLTSKDKKRAQQNLDIIKKALDEVGDFNPWSGFDEISVKKKERIPPSNPYISQIDLDKTFYQYNQTAHVKITILNPTSDYQKWVHLTVEALDKGLSQLAKWEFPPQKLPILNPATEEKKGRIVVEMDIPISSDFGEGKNFIRCTLKNNPVSVTQQNNEQSSSEEKIFDSGSHSLWVAMEPDHFQRKLPSGGTSGEGTNSGNINDLVPITVPDIDPVQNEVYPIWSEGEIWFYTYGARVRLVYETQPRAADSIIYELVAEAISEQRLKNIIELSSQNSYDKEQLLEQYRSIDEMRKKFLRACEKYRSLLK
jgi:hypothetical protein